MRSIHVTAALIAVVGLALATAGPSRADGDPASDFLLSQKVFIPFDANVPRPDQRALVATVARSAESGYPIRVAVIWSDYDLGSVTALWRKPKLYARFLGEELAFVYKGRLLVVMRNGFGFNRPRSSPRAANALLARIPIAATPDGLVQAAMTAVERLAAADGVRVRPPSAAPSSPKRSANEWIVTVVAIGAALALGLLLWLLVGHRAAARFAN